jgi:thiazole synthase ThiGH ThiG subunit
MNRFHHQGDNNRRARDVSSNAVFLRSVLRLLVTAKVLSWLILFTLMKEAIISSETSVLTIATRRHILEDSIHHVQNFIPNKQCIPIRMK